MNSTNLFSKTPPLRLFFLAALPGAVSMLASALYQTLDGVFVGRFLITISREFGSGGRELGNRLADQLGYAYYDREIEEGIAEKMDMDVNYVSRFMERGSLTNIPLHFGRTLSGDYSLKQRVNMLLEHQRPVRPGDGPHSCPIHGILVPAEAKLGRIPPAEVWIGLGIGKCSAGASEFGSGANNSL